MLTRHLQNVTLIKFSANDRYLITASDDTLLLAWDFNEFVENESFHLIKFFELEYLKGSDHRTRILEACSHMECALNENQRHVCVANK